MREILAALLLIGFTVAAPAQVVRQNADRPTNNPPFAEQSAQPSAAIPRPYDRALAVQKLLRLSIPPTLGDPISVTPAATLVPGLAELNFYMVQSVLNLALNSAGPPIAKQGIVQFQPGGYAQLVFSGEAGKRYIIDCEAGENIHYDMSGVVGFASADVSNLEPHVLIPTDTLTRSGLITVTLRAVKGQDIFFFNGCDISPF